MAVNVPVGDLRAQPHTAALPQTHDALQESQLLYGEAVRVLKSADGWSYVEVLEQPEFTHASRWGGYPGWVASSALVPWQSLLVPTVVVTAKWAPAWRQPVLRLPSPWRFAMGTRLRGIEIGGQLWKIELLDGEILWIPHEAARSLSELAALSPLEQRQAVVRSAQQFIGEPYFWGGRSSQPPSQRGQAFGVDCSGLVNVAHRSVGVEIPRDAHEQFLRARPVTALQPGDLIFLSERDNPSRIIHVMLFAGDGDVIEAPGTGSVVRRMSVAERLGSSPEHLAAGTLVDGQTVSYGSYLP